MKATEVGWRGVWVLAALAVGLRLVLLLGRGDYVAFDEGFYLLLGRSLFAGDGYSLVGIPHVALSPLFPALAGGLGALIDSWVWGGRIVAALASGLVVVPAWAVFRRLGPPRAALVAALLVAILPSMAPFVVPYWIGADLWVGAEPLLHLLLYTGIALWLRADERDALLGWALPGAALGLAFLARPEAIITWGLLGLATLGMAAARRSPRRLGGAALLGAAFLLVASPYWLHIHRVTGDWSLTGRGVAAASAVQGVLSGGARGGPAGTIERMLAGDDRSYEQRLYALDPSGLRLASEYWGIYDGDRVAPTPAPTEASAEAPAPDAQEGQPGRDMEEPRGQPSPIGLYVRALGVILPLLLWPFVVLGLAGPRGPGVLQRELVVSGSLVITSVAIAAAVAVDARTQLFLVPLLAFYAARGFGVVADVVGARGSESELRPEFVEGLLVVIATLWLMGTNARRLYLSIEAGSPHHIVAEQNRQVALELDALLERPGPIASWHPALAVYADRDWRVLPFEGLPEIIRYEQAAGAAGIILSAYYPPPLGIENLGTRYLVLPVPPPDGSTGPGGGTGVEVGRSPQPWTLRIERGDSVRAVGRLTPGDGAE